MKNITRALTQKELGHGGLTWPLLMLCLLLVIPTTGWSQDHTPTAPQEESFPSSSSTAAPYGAPRAPAATAPRWYLLIGNVNLHPRLKDASRQIDSEINRTFRRLASGFDDVKTFSDQRDEMMIWQLLLGAGYLFSDHWDVFLQTGYTAGKLRTNARDVSLILLPLCTDVRLERSSFFLGGGINYYPWGFAHLRKYDSFMDLLRNARPYMGTSVNWNYLTADGRVRAGFLPGGRLSEVNQSDRWSIWNVGTFAGVDVPLGKKTALSFDATYSFFTEHGDDFDGPSFGILLKRYFSREGASRHDVKPAKDGRSARKP